MAFVAHLHGRDDGRAKRLPFAVELVSRTAAAHIEHSFVASYHSWLRGHVRLIFESLLNLAFQRLSWNEFTDSAHVELELGLG